MGPIRPGRHEPSVRKVQTANGFPGTHPHLVEFIVLIPKDQVVCCEMEGADVRDIQLGTDDALDLFRNDR